MKVRVITAFIVGLALSAGSAQAQVGGGVKGGVAFSKITGEDDLKTRTGFIAGAYATVPAGDMVAFQPEFLFTRSGAKFEDPDGDGKINIDEFQIGLMGRFGPRDPARSAYLSVGPVIGFITKAEQKFGDETEDFKDDLKSADLSVAAAVGVVMNRFLLEGRFTRSLRKIDDSDDADENHKLWQFAVMAGIEF